HLKHPRCKRQGAIYPDSEKLEKFVKRSRPSCRPPATSLLFPLLIRRSAFADRRNVYGKFRGDAGSNRRYAARLAARLVACRDSPSKNFLRAFHEEFAPSARALDH